MAWSTSRKPGDNMAHVTQQLQKPIYMSSVPGHVRLFPPARLAIVKNRQTPSVLLGFSRCSVSTDSVYNAEDLVPIPGSGRSPGEGNGNPLQYSCLENPHGQRGLAGYSPWGRKESDTT